MTDALLADLRALACASDDGTEYEHNEGCLGEAECPACWAESIRDLIDKHAPEPEWRRRGERDELAQAAAWVAEAIGYPVETSTPDAPMPDGLWEALVDHVHADKSGRWHDNELGRDDVESWLAAEAGRRR